MAACASAPGGAPAIYAPHAQVEAGEPARGLAYAEETCGSCHALNRGALESPLVAAPTFEAIANTPGMTRIALSAWLASPHPSMPQLIVDSDRTDDLAAYLTTLKRAD